jgi:hypothetical protein
MANMISRINPWIVLDVIKIQSSPSYIHREGARSISPRSAADSIEAAIVHGADIISMSWTITALEYLRTKTSTVLSDGEGENKSAVESEMELLRKAITKAVEGDKRLLICSAADDLRISADNTLPYSSSTGPDFADWTNRAVGGPRAGFEQQQFHHVLLARKPGGGRSKGTFGKTSRVSQRVVCLYRTRGGAGFVDNILRAVRSLCRLE